MKMEIYYIGFIFDYDPNISIAKKISEMLLPVKVDRGLKEDVIKYLSSGTFLSGAMSYIYDDENKPIGDLNYYTDGVFVWPSYYIYFIKKYDNFEITKALIDQAKKSNFLSDEVSREKLIELENVFLQEWIKKKTSSPNSA